MYSFLEERTRAEEMLSKCSVNVKMNGSIVVAQYLMDGSVLAQFLFDGNMLYISGSSGYAIVQLTEQVKSPEDLKRFSTYSFQYFSGKIRISDADDIYDEEKAIVDLHDFLGLDIDDANKRNGIVSEIMSYFDEEYGFSRLSDNAMNKINAICRDFWEWAYKVGRRPNFSVILWHTALRMLWNRMQDEITFQDMQCMIAYKVVKPSSDGTFCSGDIIWLAQDGSICCLQAGGGWIGPDFCFPQQTIDFVVVRAYDWLITKDDGRETCKHLAFV